MNTSSLKSKVTLKKNLQVRTFYLNASISGRRVICSDYTGLGFVAREFLWRHYIFCINIRTYGLVKDFYPYQVQEKNLETTSLRWQNSLTLETHFSGF